MGLHSDDSFGARLPQWMKTIGLQTGSPVRVRLLRHRGRIFPDAVVVPLRSWSCAPSGLGHPFRGSSAVSVGRSEDAAQGAGFDAAMSAVGRGVGDRHMFPVQGVEGIEQACLVVLDAEDEVRATLVQVSDVRSLGVQAVCGDKPCSGANIGISFVL